MSNDDFRIIIPGRILRHTTTEKEKVVKIGIEQYNFLVDLYNESSLSMKGLVNTIIDQARDHIIIEKMEEKQNDD